MIYSRISTNGYRNTTGTFYVSAERPYWYIYSYLNLSTSTFFHPHFVIRVFPFAHPPSDPPFTDWTHWVQRLMIGVYKTPLSIVEGYETCSVPRDVNPCFFDIFNCVTYLYAKINLFTNKKCCSPRKKKTAIILHPEPKKVFCPRGSAVRVPCQRRRIIRRLECILGVLRDNHSLISLCSLSKERLKGDSKFGLRRYIILCMSIAYVGFFTKKCSK